MLPAATSTYAMCVSISLVVAAVYLATLFSPMHVCRYWLVQYLDIALWLGKYPVIAVSAQNGGF